LETNRCPHSSTLSPTRPVQLFWMD
jgi:hypothetical protein